MQSALAHARLSQNEPSSQDFNEVQLEEPIPQAGVVALAVKPARQMLNSELLMMAGLVQISSCGRRGCDQDDLEHEAQHLLHLYLRLAHVQALALHGQIALIKDCDHPFVNFSTTCLSDDISSNESFGTM